MTDKRTEQGEPEQEATIRSKQFRREEREAESSPEQQQLGQDGLATFDQWSTDEGGLPL